MFIHNSTASSTASNAIYWKWREPTRIFVKDADGKYKSFYSNILKALGTTSDDKIKTFIKPYGCMYRWLPNPKYHNYHGYCFEFEDDEEVTAFLLRWS